MHELVLSLWRRHAPTVLMVTHDVDEAIALADRVLVLDNGRIAAEERIELDRPRAIDSQFQAIRTRLLGQLGVQARAPAPDPTPHEGALLAFPTGEIVA
jgi:sulfonate transport system ATP-binding protein